MLSRPFFKAVRFVAFSLTLPTRWTFFAPADLYARWGAGSFKELPMDRNTIFGGNPLGVVLRLALISIVVGIVMKALGIDLRNFFQRINELLRNIYDLGFGAIEWVFEYMLLGALVVVPIWLIARIVGAARSKTE
jgi:hypothetical protein